jgi:hypothetical protein
MTSSTKVLPPTVARRLGVSARAVQRRLVPMGPTVMAPWDWQRIERLSQLWREGASSGVIAKAMGISRNALIGKARRLGLLGTRRAARPVKRRVLVARRAPWRPPGDRQAVRDGADMQRGGADGVVGQPLIWKDDVGAVSAPPSGTSARVTRGTATLHSRRTQSRPVASGVRRE